ncbi:MAG: glucose-6-phosphate isomerase [Kiritimatiellaeota bacterium]|nr:glucose-6-phosphate isomerase [Kiritimatiellota bacterium]
MGKYIDQASGFTLDVSGMNYERSDLDALSAKIAAARQGMIDIEAGKVKNPDENRKVTHFTDREEYPSTELFNQVGEFVEEVRTGVIAGSTGRKFESVVINGIGGSALGPQLAQFAVNGPYWNELDPSLRNGFLKIHFTDNTDSAGVADIIAVIDPETTLVVSISKSGGTQETKNNLTAFETIYSDGGVDFSKHACAITMQGSKLDAYANSAGWLQIFHMAESIGGRTSETSIVGHLPAALAGIDFGSFLDGALHMDELTRVPEVSDNPAYLLAAMWYLAGDGKGDKNMIIVPYSDRLVLLSRYLQQLVMESLGKELDLKGNTVNQGLSVFGNKGGTDAHAFIQQLNDGRNDFFVTFLEVLGDDLDLPVGDGIHMGDYLHGFQAGLAAALTEKSRQVIQMRINTVDEYNLGMIIALYERAVAFYAELIGVNAFHQPGVEAYKKASGKIIAMLMEVKEKLPELSGSAGTAAELAEKVGFADRVNEFEGILAKFAANPSRDGNTVSRKWDSEAGDWRYSV